MVEECAEKMWFPSQVGNSGGRGKQRRKEKKKRTRRKREAEMMLPLFLPLRVEMMYGCKGHMLAV